MSQIRAIAVTADSLCVSQCLSVTLVLLTVALSAFVRLSSTHTP